MAKARETRTIAVASSKGGTGKTTILSNLATLAAAAGRDVAMIDTDPQKTLSRFWQLRGEPKAPRLVEVRGSLAATVARLEESRVDFIFIDTPPSLNLLTLNALCASNSVLIPVQPDEASRFACNAVVVGRDVVMNTGCPRPMRPSRKVGNLT